MKVIIIDLENNVAEIKSLLDESSNIFMPDIGVKEYYYISLSNEEVAIPNIIKIDLKDLSAFDNKTSIIICCLENAEAIKTIIKYGYERVWLFCSGRLINLHNTASLNELQKYYLSKKNFKNVKIINSIKIQISYLKCQPVLDSYPKHVQLEHTSFCNAECIMCSHYFTKNHGAKHINGEIISKLSEIFPYCEAMVLHGYGEPFITPNIEEYLMLYKDYGIHLTTNTNLSYLPDSILNRMADSFVSLRVSCDGCTKEIFEGIRKGIKFERFIENVKKLRKHAPDLDIKMSAVAMRQNIRQVPQMVEFAKELGFSEITFSRLGTNPLIDNSKDDLINYPTIANYYFDMALERGKELGIDVVVPQERKTSHVFENEIFENELDSINSYPMFPMEEYQKKIIQIAEEISKTDFKVKEELNNTVENQFKTYSCEGICEWIIERPFIDLEGNVYACCINCNQYLGNIFEVNSFMDIWNNEKYVEIRKSFYEGKLPSFCMNCTFIINKSLKLLKIKDLDEDFFRRPNREESEKVIEEIKKKVGV